MNRLLLPTLLLSGCPTTDKATIETGTPGDTDTIDTPVTLADCGEDVVAALSAKGLPGRDSEGYPVPDEATLLAFSDSVTALIGGDTAGAVTSAEAAGYTLCEADSIARWTPDGGGGATVLLRMKGASGLILGVPHPLYDEETLTEGAVIFSDTAARALIVAGTHRCANADASSCDGVSGVCTDTDEAFRESDMAHVVDSTFQAAHAAIFAANSADLVINVHGMSRDGVSLSNGTKDPIADDAPVALLAAALAVELPKQAADITTCNSYTGASVADHLCGTTNTQGRLVNGSADACDDVPKAASEQFIHLEQSEDVRAEAAAVAAAISTLL